MPRDDANQLSLWDDRTYDGVHARNYRFRRETRAVYYGTLQWRERAKERKRIAKYHCEVCGTSAVRLQVHHVDREFEGFELPSDLLAVCDRCHEDLEGIA